MDQALLSEIEPYINRNLFSDHFLRELLPDDESWAVDDDKVRLAMQATLNLYAPRKEELPHLNEAQLEQEFVRPTLESLGHVFQVQPSLPTSEGVRRPDYAFFATREDKGQARKHKGKLDYFKKAIGIGDAKPWGRPLDKGQRRGTDKFDMLSPSWQIDYYLRTSEVPWAILTDGRFWRLYNRETSFRLDVYYEIDLPQLLAARDVEGFRYFYLFFRRQAFVRDPEGLCFLDRVYQGSLEYAREVGDGLKDSVYKALRILAEGFVQTPGNNLDPRGDLEAIHGNALIYLYRLLFINYAEDRRLLPRDTRLYKETYGLVSMEGEIASKLERQESLSPLQATYWEKLHVLFDLINRGSEPFGIDRDTLFVPPYNGGLFDPQHHAFLEENRVADRWLAQVMDLLARSKGEGVGRAFVDYSSLDVRHLGSIYEGLLEYKLRVADEEMVAIRRRGREEWVSANEAEGKRVLERVQPGQLYLATDRGERKATGSYYTPGYIVKYIVENTVEPLVEEKMKEQDPIEGILSLKVLDPAMGSGHFLVEATDSLAHALVQALGGSEEEPEEDDIRWARREVVERCIYGVDLNPLAVELAKLSLWLHTVAEGKPVNFLDHHLKVGNSLIGAWVGDLGSLPTKRRRVRLTDREEISARQMNLLEQRLNEKLPVMLGKVLEISERPSETLEDIRGKEAADQAIRELKAPFKAVADLWVSTYFGNEMRPAEYDEALQHIGEPKQLLALPAAKRASEIAEDKRFFHWELEFPEVFYEDSERRENAGFDAVVGNPPYVSAWSMTETDAGLRSSIVALARAKDVLGAHWDLYIPFLLKAYSVSREGGRFSFIIPNPFCREKYATGARKFLLEHTQMERIVSFGEENVFEEVSRQTLVPIFWKTRPDYESAKVQIDDPLLLIQEGSSQFIESLRQIPQVLFYRLPGHQIRHEVGLAHFAILDKMDEQSTRLGNLCYINYGAQVSSKQKGGFSKADVISDSPCGNAKPFFEGKNLSRYDIERTGLYLDYRPEEMYGPRAPELFESPKLVVRHISGENDSLVVGFDEDELYCDHGLVLAVYYDRVANTNLRKEFEGYVQLDDPYDLEYLLATVASKLESFYYGLRFATGSLQGSYSHVYPQHVRHFPIRRITFTTPAERRARLAEQGRKLYERCLSEGYGCLLEFVEHHMARDETDVIHGLLAYLARQMIEMNKEKQAEAKGFLDWLAGYTGLPIEDWRLKTRIKAYWEHGWDEIRRALRQNRKAIEQASGPNVEGREALEAIHRELGQSVARLKPLLERVASTDRVIDLIVYRLHGLTEEEVATVEGE